MVPKLRVDSWCGSLQLPVPGGRVQEPPTVPGEHDPTATAEEESHRGGVHLHQLWVTDTQKDSILCTLQRFPPFIYACSHP